MSDMKKRERKGVSGIIFFLLAMAVLVVFLTTVSGLEQRNSDEGRKQLELTLQRCAVACYATEGIYPPDVDYMKEHYGIQIDESKYLVQYEVFAENLMPDITVLERNDEKNGK